MPLPFRLHVQAPGKHYTIRRALAILTRYLGVQQMLRLVGPFVGGTPKCESHWADPDLVWIPNSDSIFRHPGNTTSSPFCMFSSR